MDRFVVVAALDFSSSSHAVARESLEIACRNAGAEVHFVTVQELTLEIASSPHDEVRLPELRRFAEVAVQRHEAGHASDAIAQIVVHIVVGDPAREIVALAAELDANVVVVGTHSRQGIRRLFLGSVAETVVRNVSCAVHVARERAHAIAIDEPEVAPLCTECLATRASSGGRELRCSHHASRHEHAQLERATSAPSGSSAT